MEKGNHLISACICYSHHGIYSDQNKVILYSGFALNETQPDIIEIVSLKFCCHGNGQTIQMSQFRIYDREISIERGKSRWGED